MTQTQQRVLCTDNTQSTPGVGCSENEKDKTLLQCIAYEKVLDPPQCLFVQVTPPLSNSLKKSRNARLSKPPHLDSWPWRERDTLSPPESFEVLPRPWVWKLQVQQIFLTLLLLWTRDDSMDGYCAHSPGPSDNSDPGYATLLTPLDGTKRPTTGLSFSFTSLFHCSSS